MQVAHLIERITRNFGEKGLTVAVYHDVVIAFDTFWIDDLIYKLTLLNFPSYIVHKTHPTSRVGLSKLSSDGQVISSGHARLCTSGWIERPCPHQSMCSSCPHPRTTLSWPSMRRIRPSQSLPAARRYSSATWSHTSTIINGG